MLLPKRYASAGLIACVSWCALALLAGGLGAWFVGLMPPAAKVVLLSASLGLACRVLPAICVDWLLGRVASPSVARLIAASLLRLLGAGALLAAALVWSRWVWSAAAQPKVMIAAFLLCAVSQPVFAAVMAARADRMRLDRRGE